jgi:hypothetical protein
VTAHKTLAVTTLLLLLPSCSHAPLRPFDCEKVLSLRLGQSPDEVRALLGKPHNEGAEQHLWQSEAGAPEQLVSDYTMWFNDFGAPGWLDSSDAFWINFHKDKLVHATAFRADELFVSYEDAVALALGSSSFGQPSPRNNNRPEPVRAEIGPSFDKIFQCPSDPSLEKARTEFKAQIKP